MRTQANGKTVLEAACYMIYFGLQRQIQVLYHLDGFAEMREAHRGTFASPALGDRAAGAKLCMHCLLARLLAPLFCRRRPPMHARRRRRQRRRR